MVQASIKPFRQVWLAIRTAAERVKPNRRPPHGARAPVASKVVLTESLEAVVAPQTVVRREHRPARHRRYHRDVVCEGAAIATGRVTQLAQHAEMKSGGAPATARKREHQYIFADVALMRRRLRFGGGNVDWRPGCAGAQQHCQSKR